MEILRITETLEAFAPVSYQESYDNSGLICGDLHATCSGALIALDVTEAVVQEAVEKNCNLIVSHHPLIFRPLRSINPSTSTGRALIRAIQQNIAIYAIHTNLDNVLDGVSGKIADILELRNREVLQPAKCLRKLFTFIPAAHVEIVRNALFAAGAGHIGSYDECGFSSAGTGSFRAGKGTSPFVGEVGKRHEEDEVRFEVIFPDHLEPAIIRALKGAHPYEEVAYDIVALQNDHPQVGSGVIGEMPQGMEASEFLSLLAGKFRSAVVRHSVFPFRPIQRVAVCGGAGSFLIGKALKAKADAFVTADLKYHDFFETEAKMLLCDIGHYESEQCTIELISDILLRKFPTFAVLKTGLTTNPVHYYTA